MQALSASCPAWPNGCVAEVVGQRDRLDEVLVQPEGTGDGARDLGDLDRMSEAGAEHVAFVVHEDLGLVLQAAERAAVDDPVAVALERAPVRGRVLLELPARATIASLTA